MGMDGMWILNLRDGSGYRWVRCVCGPLYTFFVGRASASLARGEEWIYPFGCEDDDDERSPTSNVEPWPVST